jgi:hypothetical protein
LSSPPPFAPPGRYFESISRSVAGSWEYQRQSSSSRWRTNASRSYSGSCESGFGTLPAIFGGTRDPEPPVAAYRRFGQVGPGTELNQWSQIVKLRAM